MAEVSCDYCSKNNARTLLDLNSLFPLRSNNYDKCPQYSIELLDSLNVGISPRSVIGCFSA